MTGLQIRFPAGRYHSTAWGSHVNEAVVEWPPSPWRILRALVATWHHKACGEISRERLSALVAALAKELPVYQLPSATPAHTRHYMPYLEGKTAKTGKIFDGFLDVRDEEALAIKWEVSLSGEELRDLDLLAGRIGYLGRAESLAEVRVIEPGEFAAGRMAFPAVAGKRGDESELVRLVAPEIDGSGVLAALEVDTMDWRRKGRSLPPGGRWVDYWRPRLTEPVRLPRGKRERPRPKVARFAVVGSVLPQITEALSLGERVHQALVSISDGAPEFTGCNEDGSPAEGHRHAFILSEPEPVRGEIRFVSVYAAGGLGEAAVGAVEQLRRTWGRGGHDLQLVLLGLGAPEEFGGVNPEAGQGLVFAKSREWVSVTPFVPTRHPKVTRAGVPKRDGDGLQIGAADHELVRLLEAGGYERPETETLPERCSPYFERRIPWLRFRRQRRFGGGRRGPDTAEGFRVVFPEPVRGPLVFGYGAHFGLGMFLPFSADGG